METLDYNITKANYNDLITAKEQLFLITTSDALTNQLITNLYNIISNEIDRRDAVEGQFRVM